MRFTLCVVMLAVFLLAMQCAATTTDIEDNNSEQDTADESNTVVATTTTTTTQTPPAESDNLKETKNELISGDNLEGSLTEKKEEDSKEEKATGDPKEQGDTKKDSPAPPTEEQTPSEREVKATTTAAVQKLSGTDIDTVQEQSAQSKDGVLAHNNYPGIAGGAEKPDVKDTAAVLTTTTTNAPANTSLIKSKIPQSVNNKDSSSSTSLLLAFATLATLAMTHLAPVW